MAYSTEIIGGLLIIVIAILAETTSGWKKAGIWVFFVVLVLALTTAQVVQKRNTNIQRAHDQEQYNKDRTQLVSFLQSGSQTISLLVQESKDTKSELARLRAGQASSPATLNAIINLEQRAQTAEEAAHRLETFYAQQLKINTWPAGATNASSAELVTFFATKFPETKDLNGLDRFFLYWVIKHNGSLGLESYRMLSKQYLQEFQIPVNVNESWRRLQRLGFLESGPMVQEPKLKEPYYSRLRGVQVP